MKNCRQRSIAFSCSSSRRLNLTSNACKLAAHRAVRAALAPDGYICFCGDLPAEVQVPEILKHFLHDGLVHQLDPVGVRCLKQTRAGKTRARVVIDV